jgi:dimethylamine/trimethylamine dehydrogenase
VRLTRELIEETKEVVAGKAAVATRFSVGLDDPESYDAFAMLSDLPDLWDLTVPNYDIEMGASRFVKEGALVDSIAKAKAMTTKPVVAVGRFTSPDTMARVIKEGSQDMIGAARPSIADPFLPSKIEAGRSEDIRECIGCNVCYAHDSLGVPIRCTQNPTMGEEWRLGWHPERVKPAKDPSKVLVVGAGPSGLEAARILGEQGHSVMLAEESRQLGGRVTREARLTGLSEWVRVRDWRVGQIEKLNNIDVYPESTMSVEDVLSLGVNHVLIATGAKWASDAIGRHSDTGFTIANPDMILNAEMVLDETPISAQKIVIYDDDHYYLGSVMALELRKRGHEVVLVTPAGRACAWGEYTDEQASSNATLITAGVEIITNQTIQDVDNGLVTLACVFSGKTSELECDAVIPLTRKIPVVDLYDDLNADKTKLEKAGIKSVVRIGDAEAPSIIAAAVHSGYRAAMDLGKEIDLAEKYGKREHPSFDE